MSIDEIDSKCVSKALKQASVLMLNAGRFDQAIDKIQRLVRSKMACIDDDEVSHEKQKELCSLWAYLGEAHRQNGNFQSAVRACHAILEQCKYSYTAKLQLILLSQAMFRYTDAIQLHMELMTNHNEFCVPDNLKDQIRLMHFFNLAKYINDEGEFNKGRYFTGIQCQLLKQIFDEEPNLMNCPSINKSSLLQHCLAQSYKWLARIKVSEVMVTDEWIVKSPTEANLRCIYHLEKIVRTNGDVADTWNDLAMGMLRLHRSEIRHGKVQTRRSSVHLETCTKCLRKAIIMSKSKVKRSEYYCNLGKVYVELCEFSKAQHCLIRALQLNSRSDKAWSMLALLFIRFGYYEEAHKAASNAQKFGSRSECWCVQALCIEAKLKNNISLSREQIKDLRTEIKELWMMAIGLQPTSTIARALALKYCQSLRTAENDE